MFYTKSERVSPPIKRIAEELISKWMRPILGKSADHKHKVLLEARYEPKNKVIKKSNLPYANLDIGSATLNVRIELRFRLK